MSVIADLIERARSIIFRRRDERELAEERPLHHGGVQCQAEWRQPGVDDVADDIFERVPLGVRDFQPSPRGIPPVVNGLDPRQRADVRRLV